MQVSMLCADSVTGQAQWGEVTFEGAMPKLGASPATRKELARKLHLLYCCTVEGDAEGVDQWEFISSWLEKVGRHQYVFTVLMSSTSGNGSISTYQCFWWT